MFIFKYLIAVIDNVESEDWRESTCSGRSPSFFYSMQILKLIKNKCIQHTYIMAIECLLLTARKRYIHVIGHILTPSMNLWDGNVNDCCKGSLKTPCLIHIPSFFHLFWLSNVDLLMSGRKSSELVWSGRGRDFQGYKVDIFLPNLLPPLPKTRNRLICIPQHSHYVIDLYGYFDICQKAVDSTSVELCAPCAAKAKGGVE